MELGATVCLPRNPACGSCPAAKFCAARAAGTERELPVKLKKPEARDVPLDLAILERDARVFLLRRSPAERRLADFWELPSTHLFPGLQARKLAEFSHRIVNDRFQVTVWRMTARKQQSSMPPRGNWVRIADLHTIPLTTVTKKALTARTPR
jgi:A/G-specific adenine glycosylase